ncbi:MAG: hypothetical protein HY706_22220 [Candidatus Hydrogenedentes bacterium]|nr:hypothetical protein [Candidatus Hydrogenedentota bacterium]
MPQPISPENKPWRYTMTAKESAVWKTANDVFRKRLIQVLGERVAKEAIRNGHKHFNIYDRDGTLVVQGVLETRFWDFASYREQDRRN